MKKERAVWGERGQNGEGDGGVKQERVSTGMGTEKGWWLTMVNDDGTSQSQWTSLSGAYPLASPLPIYCLLPWLQTKLTPINGYYVPFP